MLSASPKRFERPVVPSELRIGVVGLGEMGGAHLRAWAEIDLARVVAVCDPRPDVLGRAIRNRTIIGYHDFQAMMSEEGLDAVSIAVPTSLHRDVALAAMNHGISALIEKPLAGSTSQATEIVDAARNSDAVVTVGHIERFNPAIQTLRARLRSGDLGQVFAVKAERTGPPAFRVQEAGVVMDLATHDLDIMQLVIDSPVRSIYARCAQQAGSPAEDLVIAMLGFMDGSIGLLDTNWLSPTKTRRLTVLGEKGMYVVDYLRQDLYFYDNSLASALDYDTLASLAGVSEGDMTKIHVSRAEPLRMELLAFAEAVVDRASAPVPLEDGFSAVWLAEQVKESARTGAPIEVA